MNPNDFKVEALVNFDCQVCGKHSTYPPLQAEPGVKCKHCGAVLDFTEKHFAEKAALLLIAGNRDDVDLG